MADFPKRKAAFLDEQKSASAYVEEYSRCDTVSQRLYDPLRAGLRQANVLEPRKTPFVFNGSRLFEPEEQRSTATSFAQESRQ